ncbi:MAG: helix-turn-helix transcriptional regulator [Thermogemmatispora sp.]|uniref:HTH cro/C1-type domain-containing protein n=1 Tax=Thermogemmatispora aurantia TaxID=2045279 RepID=A0A5J4KDI7_9CHLR|nr:MULTISPECIES: helix-turn-helix transcriptional regulator [Thermogemmatispora]MBE3567241.1 helix-turn-helix transcriptional regulator [Thermogemmatispora sp.]GER84707.1 hypothetical protein KTAU_33430 [Thermogemmatispora aurantia]
MYRLRVKEHLEALGKSQQWLALQARVPESLIRRMVKDPTYAPTYITLAKVAKALRVSVDALIEELPDEDEDHRPT